MEESDVGVLRDSGERIMFAPTDQPIVEISTIPSTGEHYRRRNDYNKMDYGDNTDVDGDDEGQCDLSLRLRPASGSRTSNTAVLTHGDQLATSYDLVPD